MVVEERASHASPVREGASVPALISSLHQRVERRLPCGLRLIVEPGGAVPVAAVQLWVHTGASLERPEQSGAAHLLEHLVFKGAGDQTGAALTEQIEALGGDLNAWTSLDQTSYTATVPVPALGAALRAVSELAYRPWLRGDDLQRERGVVLEELRGASDDPSSLLGDALRARLWGAHPYGRPVLGFAPTVKALRIGDLRALHARFYRPENSVLVVVGPVDPAEVEAMVSALPALAKPADGSGAGEADAARAERRAALTARPAQPGVIVMDRGFEDRLVEVLFPVGGPADQLHPAMDLLSVAVGGGSSARLSRELRHEQDVALDVFAAIENDEDAGTFVVALNAPQGRTGDALRALGRSLGRISSGGVGPADLRRARAALRADRLSERETVDGRANRAAWTATVLGDLHREAAYEQALDAVTLDELRAAAATLRPEEAVVGALVPAGELDQAAAEAAWREGWAAGVAEAAPRLAARAARAPELLRFSLSNGLQVVVENTEAEAITAMSLVGVGGLLAEPPGRSGLSAAWASLLGRGAGGRGCLDFAAAVEDRAGVFYGWSGRSSSGASARFPTDDLDAGLSLMADAILLPAFDPDEVERTRRDLEEARRSLSDDPEGQAWERAFARLFSAHPWGRPEGGTEAGIARIDGRGVGALHRRVMVGENLHLAVVGDVDPEWLRRRLERTLGHLPPGRRLELLPPRALEGRRRSLLTIHREDATAALVLAFPGAGVGSAEEPAAMLLAGILGGAVGGGGRLFASLREEHGLAYSVAASAECSLGGGAFVCTVSADPDRLPLARRAIWKVLDALSRDGVGEAELDRVRKGIVEGSLMGFQRVSGRADRIAAVSAFEGEVEHWRERSRRALQGTAEQVQGLARAWLRRERSVESVVGPPRLRA
jgi:zinc protease